MAKQPTFEEGMQELESIAQALETGEMPLEESFAAYERAAKLKKQLEKILDEGDERIRILTEACEETLNAEEIR